MQQEKPGDVGLFALSVQPKHEGSVGNRMKSHRMATSEAKTQVALRTDTYLMCDDLLN